MDLYSYSKKKNVIYDFDNYLENLVLFKGKYNFMMWMKETELKRLIEEGVISKEELEAEM